MFHPYFQKLDITPEALEKETAGAKVGVVHSTLWGAVQDVFKEERFQKVIVSNLYDHVEGPLKGLLKAKTQFDLRKEGATIPKGKKFIEADKALELGSFYTGAFEAPFKSDRIASITSSSGRLRVITAVPVIPETGYILKVRDLLPLLKSASFTPEKTGVAAE